MGNSFSRALAARGSPSPSFTDPPREVWQSIFGYVAIAEAGVVEIAGSETCNVVKLQRVGGVPAALQICYQARAEALRVYRTVFTTINGHGVYFNPENDVLRVWNAHVLWYNRYNIESDLALVRNAEMLHLYSIFGFTFDSLTPFNNLRQLRVTGTMWAYGDTASAGYEARIMDALRDWWDNNRPPGSRIPLLSFIPDPPASRISLFEVLVGVVTILLRLRRRNRY